MQAGRCAVRAGLAGLGFGVAALAMPAELQAHPHVWATVETEILYDKNQRVSGFRHKWTFDEYYSAFAIQGLDADGDGTYSRQELAALAEENVASLNEYDYFTFVKVDGDAAALTDPRDYWLEEAGGLLTLHFTLPLKEAVDSRLGVVSFAVYDPTYYVDFQLAAETPVRLAAAPQGCKPVLGRDSQKAETDTQAKRLSEAFFEALGPGSDFGSQFAQTVTIGCQGS